MKKAMKTVSSIIFCFLFIVTCFLVITKFMGGTPSVFGYSMYYVVTGSMEPEISSGDIIIAEKARPENLEIGDIVTYQGISGQINGKIITHKIIDIREIDGEMRFITKGTANDIEDQPVAADQIISKMTVKLPFVGKIFSVINTRIGFLLIIILPLAALLAGEITSLVKVCKNVKEEQQNEAKAEESDDKIQ